jgi:hypothetical protein
VQTVKSILNALEEYHVSKGTPDHRNALPEIPLALTFFLFLARAVRFVLSDVFWARE